MARILDDLSRTFSEYLLIPRLTRRDHLPSQVSLTAPLARHRRGENSRLALNIPVVSASMQAVSGTEMAIALARQGGMAFVFCSQSIEAQAAMIAKVKAHKAGFVRSDSNVKPTATLRELLEVMKTDRPLHRAGHRGRHQHRAVHGHHHRQGLLGVRGRPRLARSRTT